MTSPPAEPDPQAQPASPQDIERWWATYNAAIAGVCGNPALIHHGFDGVHDFASRMANRSHGKLPGLPNSALVQQSPDLQELLDVAQRLYAAYLEHVSNTPVQLLGVVDSFMGPLGNALLPFVDVDPTP